MGRQSRDAESDYIPNLKQKKYSTKSVTILEIKHKESAKYL